MKIKILLKNKHFVLKNKLFMLYNVFWLLFECCINIYLGNKDILTK